MKTKRNKLLCAVLAAVLLFSLLPAPALALGGGNNAIQRKYGSDLFTKVSNPDAGSGEPDGLNTDDATGFPANRLNSYAWAMASRGDAIYIGTNRTLFGSAMNAMGDILQQQNAGVTRERFDMLLTLLSAGDVPTELEEEDYIPQIIRFDLKDGTTEVIYQPDTTRDADGVLYYVDRDGQRIPSAVVSNEAASFRSVIEFRGNLYFGSLGVNMLQLIRVDASDRAEVVYQTLGLASSLRASCLHGEGEEETLYFGGQDTTYLPWRAHRADPANAGDGVMPIVIRRLDPETAGTDHEDWSGIVADFRDFGRYAAAQVYAGSGGNVWDLCSYNGKLYLILAYEGGWAMFRGEEAEAGDPEANDFGWKWTEIVGTDSIYGYPLAMDAQVETLNRSFAEDYGCQEYGTSMNAAGLLESTATPFVYQGKMYLGSFDNATSIQSQTLSKLVTKLSYLLSTEDLTDTGPSLTQIYAPIYEVLTHPQHIWVMDETETITAVDSANALLEGTTNDYVWRFAELDGKLYAGTFDAATAYSYYLTMTTDKLRDEMERYGISMPDDLLAQLDGSNVGRMLQRIEELPVEELEEHPVAQALVQTAQTAGTMVYSLLQDGTSVEELVDAMLALKAMLSVYLMMNADQLPEDVLALIDWLISAVDVEGLQYWAKARALVLNARSGFDILVSEDGEQWETLVKDGLGDPYNYGARTFAVLDGELYVGTANPYYGAQLWRMTDITPYPITLAVSEHGSVTADRRSAARGETVTVTVAPDSGYELESLQVTEESGDTLELREGPQGSWSFEMPRGAVTVTARFQLIRYDVIPVKTENGSVTAEPLLAAPGETVTVTALPTGGYRLDSVLVTDAQGNVLELAKQQDGTWTFAMPEGPVTVTALFHMPVVTYVTYHEILLAETQHGSVQADRRSAASGTKVTVTARPEDRYAPERVTVTDMDGRTLFQADMPDGTWSFAMPECSVTVTVFFQEQSCPSEPYEDLDTSLWYHEAVDAALIRGLMQGISDRRFAPNGTVSRAMLVTILHRMEGCPAASGENPFRDVPEDAWFSDAVLWASGSGIVLGYGDGTFGPDDALTREQLVTILYRCAQLQGRDLSVGEDTNILSYDDAFEISEWAISAMQWAVGSGLVQGRSPSTLNPADTATRAEIASIATRFDA